MSSSRRRTSASARSTKRSARSIVPSGSFSLVHLLILIVALGVFMSLVNSQTERGTPGPLDSPAVAVTSPTPRASTRPTSAPGVSPRTDGPRALLDSLVVADEYAVGYSRDLFQHWIDADSNGCDTRREVLIIESRKPVSVGARCEISGGEWLSLYDDVSITDAGTIDIDHMVPLAEAWRSGAHEWTKARRRAFANDLDDPRSLIAVTARSNRSKGDRDPANWMPTAIEYHCTYATEWVVIKVRWQLTIDVAERRTLRQTLKDCPDEPLVVALP